MREDMNEDAASSSHRATFASKARQLPYAPNISTDTMRSKIRAPRTCSCLL
jgi:hypothetical protein